MTIFIQPIGLAELPAYVEHMRRHSQESGVDGDVIFMPFGPDTPFDLVGYEERRRRWYEGVVGSTAWARAFGLWDGERVVGHAELQVDTIESAVHRAGLGMGLERPYRRQGWGLRLMETVLGWARDQPEVEYIDLGVFGENAGAIALYEKLGFVERGRQTDAFRVGGQRVDDIQMTLCLNG